jgi:RPA family protein
MTDDKNSFGSSNKLMLIALVIMLVLVAFFAWKWMNTNSQLKELVVAKDQEKVELQVELDSLMAEHNRIKTEYGELADSLKAKDSIIQINANEIKKLLDTKWEYGKIKKKLDRLRTVAQGYLQQMDSLYTVNRELVAENQQIKEEFRQEQHKALQLSKDKEELNIKMSENALLSIYSLTATPLRERSGNREEIVEKGKRLEKIKVTFTVGQNKLTPASRKDFYVRIADPSGNIMVKGRGDDYSFTYKGEQLQYSAMGSIEYQNKSAEMTIYWNKLPMQDKFAPGSYAVSVFQGDIMVGETSFKLK